MCLFLTLNKLLPTGKDYAHLEDHSEPSQLSKIELFAELVKGQLFLLKPHLKCFTEF